MSTRCGHCGFDVRANEPGVRHFGFSIAHADYVCRDLLQARIKELEVKLAATKHRSKLGLELAKAIEHGGADGLSEEGCSWCWSHRCDEDGEAVPYSSFGGHLMGCPVNDYRIALTSRPPESEG